MNRIRQSDPRAEIDAINQAILDGAALPLEAAKTLPAEAYTSEAYFDYEKETIFKKEWLTVAHVSQISKPGDYITLEIVGEPIIVSRDKDNSIHVFSRVCPHRGMDIMPKGFGYDECGKARLFMCPYHSWTFELNGQLKGAPEMQKTADFNRKDYNLHEFRSEVWEGFVFMTFNAEVEPVALQLADLKKQIAPWKMAEMDVNITFEWECEFNWKNMIENWMEPYHHCGIHIKTLQPMMPARGCWTEDDHPHYTRAHLPYRASLLQTIQEAEARGEKPPGFVPIAGLPEQDKAEWVVHVGFPLYLMLTAPDRVLWYRLLPISAQRCKLITTTMVTKEAQQHPNYAQDLETETKALKDFHLEDMQVCVAVQRGMNSEAYKTGPISYLEKPVHQIQKYLARRIAATGNVPSAKEIAA